MTSLDVEARATFPILGGGGQSIDFQIVADHAKQAKANHYQTVERLAERGGLSWCELYAVLHNRRWQKMDENEAITVCRTLEAQYLAALNPAFQLDRAITWMTELMETAPPAPEPSGENTTRYSGTR